MDTISKDPTHVAPGADDKRPGCLRLEIARILAQWT